MKTLFADAMVILVAILHLYFMTLEFFLEKPLRMRAFGIKPEYAKASRTLAANQGLYSEIWAAGLICGLCLGVDGNPINVFFSFASSSQVYWRVDNKSQEHYWRSMHFS